MKASLIATAVLAVILSACFGLYLQANKPTTGGRFGRAWLDVKSLDQAVTAYWLSLGKWPPSLEVLTERFPDGGPALVKDSYMLNDPWGKPYHYDFDQLDPQSGKPLIWSDGDPRTPGAKIANWGEEPRPYSPIGTGHVAIAVVIGIVVLVVGWLVFQRIERLPADEKNPIWLGLALLTGFGVVVVGLYFGPFYKTMLD